MLLFWGAAFVALWFCATEMDVGNSGAQKEVFGHKVYDLNDSVVVWSDFLKLHLHPKTLEVVRNYQHNKLVRVHDQFISMMLQSESHHCCQQNTFFKAVTVWKVRNLVAEV